MKFTDAEISCVSSPNQLKIAHCHDPNSAELNATKLMLDELKRAPTVRTVLFPPDLKRNGFATLYSDKQIEMIEWLLSNGANAKVS